jgi:hypothetical protein
MTQGNGKGKGQGKGKGGPPMKYEKDEEALAAKAPHYETEDTAPEVVPSSPPYASRLRAPSTTGRQRKVPSPDKKRKLQENDERKKTMGALLQGFGGFGGLSSPALGGPARGPSPSRIPGPAITASDYRSR